MSKISLGNIKSESIRTIFSEIVGADSITRLQISKNTGLSLMTVGKVVDILLEKNIICQEKQIKSDVGRKAGLISLNRSNRIIVIDLTSRKFVLGVYDLALSQIYINEFEYDSCIPYFDNFRRYMYLVKKYINITSDAMNTIGICVSAPGVYNEDTDRISNKRIEELNGVNIKKTIEGIIGMKVDYIDRNARLAAISNIENIPEYDKKIAIYIHIGEGVGGTIMFNGEIVVGLNNLSGELGRIILSEDGRSVEEILTRADITRKISYLNKLIYNVIWHIDPHIIIIEHDNLDQNESEILRRNFENLSLSVGNSKRRMPEIKIVSPSIQHSHRGACIVMRNSWLEKEI